VRESRPPGSVRGVLSNGHPYRDSLLGCFIEAYVGSNQALGKEAEFGKITQGALEFARGTFAACSDEHNWYEYFELLMKHPVIKCWGPDSRLASLPASRGSPQYLILAPKLI
jgi:hypothetical protein